MSPWPFGMADSGIVSASCGRVACATGCFAPRFEPVTSPREGRFYLPHSGYPSIDTGNLSLIQPLSSLKLPNPAAFADTIWTQFLKSDGSPPDNGELGHKNVCRLEDTYGNPNHFRPRGEVVEYRV